MLSAGEAQQRAAMLPNLSECRAAAPTSVTAAELIRAGKDPAIVVDILEQNFKAQINLLAEHVEDSKRQMSQMQTNLQTAIAKLEIQFTALDKRVSQLEAPWAPAAAPPRQW